MRAREAVHTSFLVLEVFYLCYTHIAHRVMTRIRGSFTEPHMLKEAMAGWSFVRLATCWASRDRRE